MQSSSTANRWLLRATPELFDLLKERLAPRLTKMKTMMREPLEPGLKLAMTLLHLASGDKYTTLEFLWHVPKSTISELIPEVCQAIIDEFGDEHMASPVTCQDWLDVAQGFQDRWQFHHCLGALDGKHVRIRQPPKSHSTYFIYKGYFSIVFLGLADHRCRFIWYSVGAPGSASDAQIWNHSGLLDAVEKNELDLPKPAPLPHDDEDMPYFFIGDDAFRLRPYMMKPMKLPQGEHLSHEEGIFNYRLSRARRVIENAFGILAMKWQFLFNPCRQKADTIRKLVLAAMTLHNLFIDRFPWAATMAMDHENEDGLLVPGSWRNGRQMDDIERVEGNQGNRETKTARNMRSTLKQYYNAPVGAVPGQERRANHMW